MLISVIIPVYKVEKYLNQSIESILNQTIQNIEIILVDDGSPDNCGKICDIYAEKYNNIKVVHRENGGLSAARNTGFENSTGDYICFIDSDDFVSQDFCENLYNLLKDRDYDYAVCGVCKYNDGEKPAPEELNGISEYTNFQFLEQQLNHNTVFCVWNKMYRRSSIEKLRFKEGKLHEDLIWSADIASNCINGVIETKKQCYFYRQRQGSIVSNSLIKCSPDFIYAGSYIIETVNSKCPSLYPDALAYALLYPWSFVDKIFVNRKIRENKKFLNDLQELIKKNYNEISKFSRLSSITKKRMKVFSKGKFWYGINAYIRLLRVYLYKILKKDAQSDGHGI